LENINIQEVFAYLEKNPVDITGLPMDYEVIVVLVLTLVAGR
jgi:hypothetical protein